jgi:hypothetical protein
MARRAKGRVMAEHTTATDRQVVTTASVALQQAGVTTTGHRMDRSQRRIPTSELPGPAARACDSRSRPSTASLPARRIAVVGGRGRRCDILAAQLTGAGWRVIPTRALDHAMDLVTRHQPDLVLFELELVRAARRTNVPSVQVTAPEAMLVTFGGPRTTASVTELASCGVWCHLAEADELDLGRVVERLRGSFELALSGAEMALPLPVPEDLGPHIAT